MLLHDGVTKANSLPLKDLSLSYLPLSLLPSACLRFSLMCFFGPRTSYVLQVIGLSV